MGGARAASADNGEAAPVSGRTRRRATSQLEGLMARTTRITRCAPRIGADCGTGWAPLVNRMITVSFDVPTPSPWEGLASATPSRQAPPASTPMQQCRVDTPTTAVGSLRSHEIRSRSAVGINRSRPVPVSRRDRRTTAARNRDPMRDRRTMRQGRTASEAGLQRGTTDLAPGRNSGHRLCSPGTCAAVLAAQSVRSLQPMPGGTAKLSCHGGEATEGTRRPGMMRSA